MDVSTVAQSPFGDVRAADYLADWKTAQAAGHHVDCDGYRTAHRVEIRREMKHGVALYAAVCEECGPLHVGTFGNERDAAHMSAGHSQEVACDGRCREWDAA